MTLLSDPSAFSTRVQVTGSPRGTLVRSVSTFSSTWRDTSPMNPGGAGRGRSSTFDGQRRALDLLRALRAGAATAEEIREGITRQGDPRRRHRQPSRARRVQGVADFGHLVGLAADRLAGVALGRQVLPPESLRPRGFVLRPVEDARGGIGEEPEDQHDLLAHVHFVAVHFQGDEVGAAGTGAPGTGRRNRGFRPRRRTAVAVAGHRARVARDADRDRSACGASDRRRSSGARG